MLLEMVKLVATRKMCHCLHYHEIMACFVIFKKNQKSVLEALFINELGFGQVKFLDHGALSAPKCTFNNIACGSCMLVMLPKFHLFVLAIISWNTFLYILPFTGPLLLVYNCGYGPFPFLYFVKFWFNW